MRIINRACCSSWHDMYKNIQKQKGPVYLIALNINFISNYWGVQKKAKIKTKTNMLLPAKHYFSEIASETNML